MIDDPVRQCLKVDAWPEADRAAWSRSVSVDDFFAEETTRAAHWRPPTRKRVRQAYGRWIAFLAGTGRLDATAAPAERITPVVVRDYVLMLEDQVAPWTTWTYVTGLHQAACAFAPDLDWGWLYRITARLKARRRAAREKMARMRPAAEIAARAIAEMDGIGATPDRRPSVAARYRDDLMIAVLVNCPVRLRNLAMIEIDRHLRRSDDGFALHFDPDEVKTHRYLRMAVPAALVPYLRAWLGEWRPCLVRDPGCRALWIGITGRPMTASGVGASVRKVTSRAFGRPINPHLFRDIAATSTAIEDPGHVGITGPILGHTNPATTEAHYIHADQVRAGRRHRQSVDALRRKLAPLLRTGNARRSRRAGTSSREKT